MAARKRDKDSSAMLAAHRDRPVDRLLAAAEQSGQDEAVLAEMLWLIQAHPELIGLVEICRHLQDILILIPEVLGLALDPLELDGWNSMLAWVVAECSSLANTLFQDVSQKERFFQSRGRNPILGLGAKQHGLCRLLWESYPDKGDPKLQRNFRLLQAHLLIAHMAVVRYESQRYPRWELGAEPYTGFLESLYVPTMAARKFDRDIDGWRSALRTLPVHRGALELLKNLRPAGIESAFYEETPEEENENVPAKNPENELSRARGKIAGFLERGLEAENYRRKFHVDHGDGDTEERETEATAAFGDAEDTTHRHVGNVHLSLHWNRNLARKRELLEADEHPAEGLANQAVQLAEEEAAAGLARCGSLEKANQLLPWSYAQLSTVEVARSLRALRKVVRERKPEVLELLALVSTVLWTGSSLDQAVSLLVCLNDTPEADCDLSLRLGRATETAAPAVWRVRALTLPYRTEQKPVPRKDRQRRNFFDLPDVAAVGAAIEELLIDLRAGDEDPLAQTEAMRQQPLRIFSKELKWYEVRLCSFFKEQDPSGRTTIGKMSKLLMQHIVERSGGDLASAALITRTDHYLASVRRFYATPAVLQLESLYCDAVASLTGELSRAGYDSPPTVLAASQGNGDAVGSRLCPTRAAVQKAVHWLQWKSREKLPVPGSQEQFETEFVSRHNWYTLYCVWSFGLAVGMRGVRTPYLHASAIDPHSGFAAISDKDSGSGYRLRLVWVPPRIREQMKLYEEYLTSLKARGLPPARQKMPCYFLDDSFTPRVVRPATIKPLLQKFFPFPTNVARRFIRTELLELGISPEIMDAWMGHWFQGEEPWGMYSSFSFADYRQALEDTLVPFLDKLGLKPIALKDRP